MDTVINISFTLKDIIYLFFSVLGLGIFVYLFLILKEVYVFLKSSRELCFKNKKHINSLIEDSATIVNKVSTLAENIPNEPFSFLGNMKESFPLLQGLIALISGLFHTRRSN